MQSRHWRVCREPGERDHALRRHTCSRHCLHTFLRRTTWQRMRKGKRFETPCPQLFHCISKLVTFWLRRNFHLVLHIDYLPLPAMITVMAARSNTCRHTVQPSREAYAMPACRQTALQQQASWPLHGMAVSAQIETVLISRALSRADEMQWLACTPAASGAPPAMDLRICSRQLVACVANFMPCIESDPQQYQLLPAQGL